MKRLTAVLFLSIFILQAFGYFFTYRLIKWHIHKEISTQISQGRYESSAIACITLNEKQQASLIWEEENEFCYQEEWYDIVEVKQTGALTTYFCIKDNQESKLVSNFNSISKNQDQHSSGNNFRYTLKKLSDNYFSTLYSYTAHTFLEHIIFSSTSSSPAMPVFLSIQDPPPEV